MNLTKHSSFHTTGFSLSHLIQRIQVRAIPLRIARLYNRTSTRRAAAENGTPETASILVHPRDVIINLANEPSAIDAM